MKKIQLENKKRIPTIIKDYPKKTPRDKEISLNTSSDPLNVVISDHEKRWSEIENKYRG